MLVFSDLFQWDRFITPSIIKNFYKMAVVLICVLGVNGIWAGLANMAVNVASGFMVVLASILGVLVGVVFARIVAEYILIVFRINDHLSAIRDQGEMQ